MNIAFFDFDGTITFEDTFTPFVYFAVEPLRIQIGKVLLAPLALGYRLGAVPGTVIRQAIVHVGFRGTSAAHVQRLGRRYAAEVIPPLVRPAALERIRWHRGRGDRVVVVSASLDVYLGAWCEVQGVELICTQLETRDGVLTGRYRGGDCAAEAKARRILASYDLTEYGEVYAYGDSKEDSAMLDLAHKRFFRWQELAA